MAGNIIPAIATTNAIIAGLIVLEALQILRGTYDELVWPYLTAKPNKPITGSQLPPPNPNCGACQDTYTIVRCNPDETTLGQLIEEILENVILGDGDDDDSLDSSEVNVFEAGRLLADPDFDSNLEKSLSDLGCGRGKFISIVDEDDRWNTLTVAVCLLPCVTFLLLSIIVVLKHVFSDNYQGASLLMSPSNPQLRPKPKVEAVPSPEMDIDRSALKRKYDAEDDTDAMEDDGPAKKKKKSSINASPSKAQRLEEDGLVILDDEIIAID